MICSAVRREMSVILDRRQRPEPDVTVVRADAVMGADQTAYPADAVVLAIEVVSPDSEIRDRERKPQLYARAGISHFWRVEDDGSGNAIVYIYELDPASSTYALTGIFHDQVKVDVPFGIDVDLTEIRQL
ncbi:Uma2 family endonuclease [Dactylosporangium matsuzakiense]|nr:Uma2 family endonuclease [Dactylosporangium matsuzakiense]